MLDRFLETIDRGLWTPRRNSTHAALADLENKTGRDGRIVTADKDKPELSEEELNARHAEKMRKKKAARDKIMATKTIEKGLLIVHTGKGKGKSTAGFGMVFRSLGHGHKVGVVQFVKGRIETGERMALERFSDLVTIKRMGEGFTWETQDRQRDIDAAQEAWNAAKAMITSGRVPADPVRRTQHRVALRLSRHQRSGRLPEKRKA